jgi:beta-phosphoglucomutase-like phosphatase (HAD superfamily)/tRNA A-37 threonylcarbamoyl transferase component Bud32/molybdopterin-guanine dinucleotide biosynthesis protein A
MNIIIPLCGKGERFLKKGYIEPKPLIKIFEKTMIEYVLDNLIGLNNEEDNVYIIYNSNLNNSNFNEYISSKYSFIKLIQINYYTKGAAETLLYGIHNILHEKYTTPHKKCLIMDCDTFYTQNVIDIFRNLNDNSVFYVKNNEENPIYSYISGIEDETETDNFLIQNIKEKIKISDNANTGAYGFNDINILYNYCKHIVNNNITFNNEPYISCIISEMLKTNHIFKGIKLNSENVFSLGTPESVEKYKKNTYAFLFDLDGTLVITDEIYFEVWKEICLNENIVLTDELFNNFIRGNNDKHVLNTLLFNSKISLSQLSNIKDELFFKKMDKIKIIDGCKHFLKKNKLLGHKNCIVTNSNKIIANKISQHIGIQNLIDFIISNDDCFLAKPNIEPYKKAIEKYDISNEQCIIFEDSSTGLLSAKGVFPKILIGIETIYNKKQFLNFDVNFSISNYNELDDEFISTIQNYDFYSFLKKVKNVIKTANIIKEEDIKNIEFNNEKLKGGFISDVISFKIITKNDECNNYIFKIENYNENNISIMANKLELYQREYYFYENISKNININVPIFYKVINVDEKTFGIVLENLFEKRFKNNLNLNVENFNVSLTIVDRMAKMHSYYWNYDFSKLPELKNTMNNTFSPFLQNFIEEKYELFKYKWFNILNENQQKKCNEMYLNFSSIQKRLSENNITFIHGDIKSPNIFYDIENNYEPYFIDWQHCGIGKGTQDLIFLIIESFEIKNIKSVFNILKKYYYTKIIEYCGESINYSFEEYEKDLKDAICYIPFFTSIWFGTIHSDELIDKNFPRDLIFKLFYLIEIYDDFTT